MQGGVGIQIDGMRVVAVPRHEVRRPRWKCSQRWVDRLLRRFGPKETVRVPVIPEGEMIRDWINAVIYIDQDDFRELVRKARTEDTRSTRVSPPVQIDD